MKISSRVTFWGNCRKAIEFYKDVFQIESVEIKTFEDASELLHIQLSEDDKKLIYTAELKIESDEHCFSIIMGDSPAVIFSKEHIGNKNNLDNITFEISCITKEQIKIIYEKLSAEGKTNMALQKKDSYELYGSVIDKHGVCWNLCC